MRCAGKGITPEGQALKDLRKPLGLRQKDLADILKMTARTIGAWESGQNPFKEWLFYLIEYRVKFGEWRTVCEETLPPCGEQLLLKYGEYICVGFLKEAGEKKYFIDSDGNIKTIPEYWRYLDTEVSKYAENRKKLNASTFYINKFMGRKKNE